MRRLWSVAALLVLAVSMPARATHIPYVQCGGTAPVQLHCSATFTFPSIPAAGAELGARPTTPGFVGDIIVTVTQGARIASASCRIVSSPAGSAIEACSITPPFVGFVAGQQARLDGDAQGIGGWAVHLAPNHA